MVKNKNIKNLVFQIYYLFLFIIVLNQGSISGLNLDGSQFQKKQPHMISKYYDSE